MSFHHQALVISLIIAGCSPTSKGVTKPSPVTISQEEGYYSYGGAPGEDSQEDPNTTYYCTGVGLDRQCVKIKHQPINRSFTPTPR